MKELKKIIFDFYSGEKKTKKYDKQYESVHDGFQTKNDKTANDVSTHSNF